ncbi:high affinity copper uptake protein 1 [Copidosoma floridanum]|uniref:high affinity copper uptake protein 1 n=1 Tax=Copidosoma floridanum TaxID=29053 RepID=UPI0006C97CA5|nr:high affinity copper uptake protein 1 [Copidosoma floridanum]
MSHDHASMAHGLGTIPTNSGHLNHNMDSVHHHHMMDHGNMNSPHDAVDATDSCATTSHMMHMAFHGGFCETVLFDAWKISSISGLIGSIIGIIIMSALYEGLKYYREYLFWKTYNALQYRSVSMPQEKNGINSENRVVQPTMLSWMHAFQTVLHIVQVILSYFLMLIFMTYNSWLCAGVVVGAAIGYFLFGWKKSVIVDVTEHCH